MYNRTRLLDHYIFVFIIGAKTFLKRKQNICSRVKRQAECEHYETFPESQAHDMRSEMLDILYAVCLRVCVIVYFCVIDAYLPLCGTCMCSIHPIFRSPLDTHPKVTRCRRRSSTTHTMFNICLLCAFQISIVYSFILWSAARRKQVKPASVHIPIRGR